MAYNQFFFFETVQISNGDTAVVKNYYPSNNFVVLFAHSNNDITSIKPGMTITGKSSGYSKLLTEWDYSTPDNGDYYDENYNEYPWLSDIDLLIVTENGDTIVMEDKMFLPEEIADLQVENALRLDK